MNLSDSYCHTATIEIAAPSSKVFDFMLDVAKMGQWAYGAWGLKPAEGNVCVGESLYDGKPVYVRIKPSPEILQLDYEVGDEPDSLVPRVAAKVLPREQLGGRANSCLLTMISWRGHGTSDERWRLTCGSHEAEVFRIRHLIEAELS